MDKTSKPTQPTENVIKPYKISVLGLGNERDVLLENLSLLVNAGMPVTTALKSSATEGGSKQMQKIIEAMVDDIDTGRPLWQTFEASRLFSPYAVSLVRIGEESGTMVKNLKAVSDHQAKERLFRSQLRSAMAYPILILCLTVVLGLGIAVFILPKLSDVFSQLRIELPLATRVLISTGRFFDSHSLLIIPITLIAIGTVVYLLFIYKKFKWVGQAFLFKVPVLSKLMREVELARFGYLFGGMLEAGLPITQAIAAFCTATPYRKYRKFYSYLEKSVEDGHSLQESFKSYTGSRKMIPGQIQQLIAAGEQSGALADTLLKIGETYEAKTEITTKNFTTMLEPVMLIIVWLGVIGVALGVILPIYSLIGGLNS